MKHDFWITCISVTNRGPQWPEAWDFVLRFNERKRPDERPTSEYLTPTSAACQTLISTNPLLFIPGKQYRITVESEPSPKE